MFPNLLEGTGKNKHPKIMQDKSYVFRHDVYQGRAAKSMSASSDSRRFSSPRQHAAGRCSKLVELSESQKGVEEGHWDTISDGLSPALKLTYVPWLGHQDYF